MRLNAPTVQNSVNAIVKPSQGADMKSTGISAARGAPPASRAPARAVNTAASKTNIINVTGIARLPANSRRSSQRIWPMKNSELISVSSSPRPRRSSRQSKRPSTATPASTSPQLAHTTAGGSRRARSATQTGIMMA